MVPRNAAFLEPAAEIQRCYDRVIMTSREADIAGTKILMMGAENPLTEAIAESLAAAGADLALTTATPDPDQAFSLQRLARRLSNPDRRVTAESVDMANGANIQIAIRKQAKELGGLDILIASPDVHLPMPAERMSDADWTKIVNANLSGAFYACRGAAREMARNDPVGGAIIFLTPAKTEQASEPESAYVASKAGAEALLQSLAQEWRQKHIRVSSIVTPADTADAGLVTTAAARVLELASSDNRKIVSPQDRQ